MHASGTDGVRGRVRWTGQQERRPGRQHRWLTSNEGIVKSVRPPPRCGAKDSAAAEVSPPGKKFAANGRKQTTASTPTIDRVCGLRPFLICSQSRR